MSTMDDDQRTTSNHPENVEIDLDEKSSDRNEKIIENEENSSVSSIDKNLEKIPTELDSNKMVEAQASFTDATSIDLQPGVKSSSVARILIKAGQIFRVQIDNQVKIVHGPATLRMISENRPDFPLPLHLPPGHMVQHVVDENGVLTHVIVSQSGPLPPPPPPLAHHPLHTGYTSHYYGHPHAFHSTMPYGSYVSKLSHYSSCSTGNPGASSSGSQAIYQSTENNSSSNNTNSTSMANNSTNHHVHHNRRHSPVYDNNSSVAGPGSSHTRNMNSGNSKRRGTGSHGHSNSYVNNSTMNGSSKNCHNPHPHHNYATFYPEMIVQNVTDSSEPSAMIEFDTEQQIIEKSLLTLSTPTIEDVGSRSVIVRIQPPNIISAANEQSIDLRYLAYELWLSDKGNDAKYKQVYRGDATEITLKDLKPATEFHLKVCATLNGCSGDFTDSVTVTTECCEPDGPLPPKLLGSRQRNALNLKWLATNDNGSKLLNYILEYDEGNGKEFVEIYRGLKKHFMINKLNPATFYTFRLAAENAIGRSEYSQTVQLSTLGTVPTEPEPPTLVDRAVNHLTLSWIKRSIDESFTLQIFDETNVFRNQYTGTETTNTIKDLRRNTEYRFRLAAHNQSGQSNFSEIVTFQTLPSHPDPPGRPRIKGQVQATQCRIAWDPPKEDGGAEIEQYHLEVEDSKGFRMIYNGTVTEYLLEQLIPGHSYSLRVSCSNLVGQSEPSPSTQIKTPAVAPASCAPPKLVGKPKSNSLHLRWNLPDYDGGASVTEFEVQMINPDQSSRTVYRGRELDCAVAGLSPGQIYQFQTRAFNRAGAGPWSDLLEVLSGPGLPEAPKNLTVGCHTATTATISWEESNSNGAPIHEYRLEWSRKENESFAQLYCGPNCNFEAKNLSPVTQYYFRVQAVNTAGPSPYSILASCVTAAGVPSVVTGIKIHTKSTSMSINWKEPCNNGSSIIAYHIDLGEKELVSVGPEAIEHTIDEVLPDTFYKVRIRAINEIGQGPFSSTIKCQTKCLPPDTPQLECTLTTCNSIKLKWISVVPTLNRQSNESVSQRSINYSLEMKSKDGNFNCIYSGNLQTHKVNKLQENSTYSFRICARNEAGSSAWSNIESYKTMKAPPNALKAPQISEITSNSCVFHWQTHRSLADDSIDYILQLQVYKKDNEYTEIYHGPCTSFRAENLQSGVEYRARVCAIRLTTEGLLLNSPFSPATQLVLPRREELLASLPKSTDSHRRETNYSLISRMRGLISRKIQSLNIFESQTLTDQQWAFVISVAFALLAVFIAIFANVIYSRYNNSSSIDNGMS